MAGNVTFYEGGAVLGSTDVVAALDGSGHEMGTASLVLSTLGGGTDQLTATFGGGNGYSVSTSSPVIVSVTKIATTTAIAAAGVTNVPEGTPVVITATVTADTSAGPPPTGSVDFTSNAARVGTVGLVPDSDAGPGTTATASLVLSIVGSYEVVASYSGDTYYLPSSESSPVAATITPTIAISPGAASAPPGGTLSFSTTGSAGAVNWAVQTSASGGTINQWGYYAAGPTGNVTDVIAATDASGATATASVSVGAGVSIDPATPSVQPGGTVAFAATGGSGTGYVWQLTASPSGGTIAPTGVYVAGAEGSVTDTVQVTDSLGNVATTTVSVSSAPSDAGLGDGGPSSGGAVVTDGGGNAAGTGPGKSGGGCGCREARRPPSSATGIIGALGLVVLLRRRRLGKPPGVPCVLAVISPLITRRR